MPASPFNAEAAEPSSTEVLDGRPDNRKFRRHDFRTLAIATIYPPNGRENEPPYMCFVLTRNVSRGGLCILHPTPLFHSQRIDLELPDGRKFTLAIRWVTRMEHGRYVIGCRFAEIAEFGQ
ncbi:MAG: PilZ domain-containing protein [Planctomycetia bacterium]|nr:PilZ domain-containing protein [Planctomycetia bacterium]